MESEWYDKLCSTRHKIRVIFLSKKHAFWPQIRNIWRLLTLKWGFLWRLVTLFSRGKKSLGKAFDIWHFQSKIDENDMKFKFWLQLPLIWRQDRPIWWQLKPGAPNRGFLWPQLKLRTSSAATIKIAEIRWRRIENKSITTKNC